LPDHPSAPREPIAIPIEADEPVPVAATVGVGVGAAVRGRIDDMAARLAVAAPGLRPGSGPPGEDGVRQPGDRQRIADRIAARTRTVYGLNHTLAAPLTADGAVVGAIILSHRTAGAWSPVTRRILAGAAVEASAALVRVTSHQAAEVHASTDALTGLPNRRYFDEFCGLLARRRRAGDAIGVLMIDIDRFKVLNDTHGHHTGDEVLRAVGGASSRRFARTTSRRGTAREFVVLLRNPSPDVASTLASRSAAAPRPAPPGSGRGLVSVGSPSPPGPINRSGT
jgi:GGDEF domain-containing protein